MESSHQSNQQSERRPLLDPIKKKVNSSDNPSTPPAGKPEFGARPISLLEIDIKGKQFYLSQAAKKQLESLKGECYVTSVSGNPAVGKSSLLNLLLSIFGEDASQENISYKDMYPVGDGKRRMTDGIDMFCLSRNGKNFIFLDVEGDNDLARKKVGTWVYSNLIQTAVGMSHVHLHNYTGIPHDTYCSYFETTSQIVKQNRLHAEFQTKYAFFRRNSSEQDRSAEEFQEFKSTIDERLSESDIDFYLHLLPTPPQHIIEKRSKTSCIGLTGFLCKDCQSHEFTKKLLILCRELNDQMSKMAPFKNGSEVAKIIEQLTVINKREVPFFLDGGHISKMRLERIAKEQIRIQQDLLKIEQGQLERSLSKQIEKILNEHSKLADPKMFKDFNDTQSPLGIKISQMAYIIPKLSQFVDKYLLDDRASILDEQEKIALQAAYVLQFEELTKDVIDSLQKYDKIITSLCTTLLDLKIKIRKNLNEYMMASSGALKKFIASDVKEAAKQLEKIGEFVTELIDDLKKTRQALWVIRQDEEKRKNLDLIENISKAMDDKISGKNLSDDRRAQILEGMRLAEVNLESFKNCL